MTNKDNDISDLIPDYCNKRLDVNGKAYFESRLQEDQKLRDECNDFLEFQRRYRQIDPGEPPPSDVIFNQISRKIGVPKGVERKAPLQSHPLVESVRHFWQQVRESITVPWLLAAAQAAVIVLLLIPAPKQNTYSTLSAPGVVANGEKIAINVVFRPNALESDIRSLLHAIQGSVSGGPSREGHYVVSISNKSDLGKAVLTLKQSEIVLLAEPVY